MPFVHNAPFLGFPSDLRLLIRGFGTNTPTKKYRVEALILLELLNLLKIMVLFPETVIPITVVISYPYRTYM